MTTDAGQTDQSQGEPQSVSLEDFRRFQSAADQRQAASDARLAEANTLVDEAFSRLTDTEKRLAAFEERGYDEHDPQVAALLKQRDAQVKDAQTKVRGYELREKQLLPMARESYCSNLAWDLADGNRTLQAAYKESLMAGNGQKQIDAIAQAIRTGGPGQTKPRAPTREEVDTGRGTGRAGAGTRLSVAGLVEMKSADAETRGAYIKRFEDAMRRGETIPDR